MVPRAPMTRYSSLPMVRGADRKPVSAPSAASRTAWPVPAQALSAAWIRAVSGASASSAALNSWLAGLGRAEVTVAQVPGTDGWVTGRVSPIADDWRWDVGRAH